MEYAALTLWTGLFPIEDMSDYFWYYHVLYKLLYLMQCRPCSDATENVDDDEFRFNDASTHEGHLRQNG